MHPRHITTNEADTTPADIALMLCLFSHLQSGTLDVPSPNLNAPPSALPLSQPAHMVFTPPQATSSQPAHANFTPSQATSSQPAHTNFIPSQAMLSQPIFISSSLSQSIFAPSQPMSSRAGSSSAVQPVTVPYSTISRASPISEDSPHVCSGLILDATISRFQ